MYNSNGVVVMKSVLTLWFVLLVTSLNWNIVCGTNHKHVADIEDNDFAEFEEFDDDEEAVIIDKKESIKESKVEKEAEDDFEEVDELENEKANEEDVNEEDDAIVEDEENDFDHFQDEEEFEGYDSERVGPTVGKGPDVKEGPKITIAKVPLHLRTNWDSYVLEIMMVGGLFVYFLNFFTGKSKNQRLANSWFNAHRQLLEDNFSLVGDDGKLESDGQGGLIKESENMYTLWCSGRAYCEGMLVELKFIKRQDLIGVISQMFRPKRDQIHIKVHMNKDDMDTFVFFLGHKKITALLAKELVDLSTYCTEKKSGEKHNIPANFVLLSEIGEVSSAVLDNKFLTVVNQYTDLIDFIHFSDQYAGARVPDDNGPNKLPDSEKMLLFGFNVPSKAADAMEQMKPLMKLVFYCMDKIKKLRLSKEGKVKADRNRARVEEAFLKSTHAARAEAAASKREEKKRQEKERIMQEDDPEKQRKWEERENRRQLKKKGPKMKQLKVKAL